MSLKQIVIRATPEFLKALDDHISNQSFSGNRADWILAAIRAKAAQEGSQLPGAKAPQGVRSDVLPAGWLSRLYQDRYQLVAVCTNQGIDVTHLHKFEGEITNVYDTLRADEVAPGDALKIEVTVLNVPAKVSKQDLTQELRFAIMEWIYIDGA